MNDIWYRFRRYLAKRRWRREGARMLEYSGYTCGCCGAGVSERFYLPEYRSSGEWQDTIGICPKCRNKEQRQLTWQEMVGWE